MPSVLNGGKDLCRWCKNDRVVFATIREPLLTVLGEYYSGFTEIALGESLFERNTERSYAEELILLNTGQYEAEMHNNIQLWFAALAATARIYASQGKLDTAIRMIKSFRARVSPEDAIAANIDAFLVQLTMMSGDFEKANIGLTRARRMKIRIFISRTDTGISQR